MADPVDADDWALTRALAAELGVDAGEQLAVLAALPSELTEWSINSEASRGTLRVSVWSKDRHAIADALARCAPGCLAERAAIAADDHEGLGLAMRAGEPPSVRWWGLTRDGGALAARVGAAWPQHRDELERLVGVLGGASPLCGVGLEANRRATLYAELRTPAAAIAVLEEARVLASGPARWFFRALLGLGDEAARPWPKVWVGRSVGIGGGWKFYYFARGDELRRTDDELLAAIAADAALCAAHARLRAYRTTPWIQLIGLTVVDERPPSFTVYLATR